MSKRNYYLDVLWRFKISIAIISIVGVIAVFAISIGASPVYEAISYVRVGDVSNLSVSGYTSTIGSGEQVYMRLVEIVGLPPFKKEVDKVLIEKEKHSVRLKLDRYELEAKQVKNSDILEIHARSSNPLLSQQAADSTASVLVESSKTSGEGLTKGVRDKVASGQIKKVDELLANLRKKYEAAKVTPNVDQIENKVKLGNIEDEINAALELRRTYSEYLARLSIIEALGQENIQIMYKAELPSRPTTPDIIRTALIALAIGLGLGFISALVRDYRLGLKKE